MSSPVVAKPYVAGVLSATPITYNGLVLRETAGAVATVRVWDNASSASGTLLDTVAFIASASVERYHSGVRAEKGLFLETVAGAVEGSVRVS